MEISALGKRVLRLESNRVWRTYSGGKKIEQWQGKENASDNEMPEEWIASVVHARNPGREHIENEGLSKVVCDGSPQILLDLIKENPIGFLGEKHYKKYGLTTAVLIKILDSLERLTVQVHPDKQFAMSAFNSEFGKTEAWYILGGREVEGEKPYVLLGFKPGTTREQWKSLFEEQDIQGMLDCLHKVPVQEGDTFLLEGGVPHAIGSGCFMVEIQEPTDYTIRVERMTPTHREVPDMLIHQGLGFDRMFDCFHYDAYDLETTLDKWKIEHRLAHSEEGYKEYAIIDDSVTKLFEMNRVIIDGQYIRTAGDMFSTYIILKGEGVLDDGVEKHQVEQGDMLFCPAGVEQVCFEKTGEVSLEIMVCNPPK